MSERDKTISADVLKNMLVLAVALASEAAPEEYIPINLCKIQKLAVSIWKKIAKHDGKPEDVQWMVEKADKLAKELNASFKIIPSQSQPNSVLCLLVIGDQSYSIW